MLFLLILLRRGSERAVREQLGGHKQQMDKVSPPQKHGRGCQVLQVQEWWIHTHTLLPGLPAVCHTQEWLCNLCFCVNEETAVM